MIRALLVTLIFVLNLFIYLFIYFRVTKKVILRWLITASKCHYIFYEAYPFHTGQISDAQIFENVFNYLKNLNISF